MLPLPKDQLDTIPTEDVNSRNNVLRVIDGGNNVSLSDEAEKGGGWISDLMKGSRMRIFGAFLRLGMPVFLATATGCATIGRQISRVGSSHQEAAYSAYEGKDYLEARHQMQNVSGDKLSESDKELIAKIERAIKGKRLFFLRKTSEFEGNKLMKNDYVQALDYYQLAYDHMSPDDPLYASVKKRIDDLEELVDKLKEDYDTASQAVDQLSKEADLIKDNNYIKLAAAIYTMQKNAAQLNIDNSLELFNLCLDFSKKFLEEGEEKQATLYIEMAKRFYANANESYEKMAITQEYKDAFASSTVSLEEYERTIEVNQLKEYAKEFVEIYADKKNPNRKRLVELSYEIVEHPYKEDLEGNTIVEDAEKIKEGEDQKISEAKRKARARARVQSRARAKKAAEAKAKAKAEARSKMPLKQLITSVDSNGNRHAVPMSQELSKEEVTFILQEYNECRRLRNLELKEGIAHCETVLKMKLSPKQKEKVEGWLKDLKDIFE